MASTYTGDLRIEQIATGEKAGEWGDITTDNLKRLEYAISGQSSLSCATSNESSGSPAELSLGNSTVEEEGRAAFVELVAAASPNTPTAAVFVKLEQQSSQRLIHIRNNTGFTAKLFQDDTYDANNDFELPDGKDALIRFDGGGSSAVVSLASPNTYHTTVETTSHVIVGDELRMPTNTAGNILVANSGGTGFDSVAMSGDASISSTGAVTVSGGTATDIATPGGFTIEENGTNLEFKYNGTRIARLTSTGTFEVDDDLIAVSDFS